MSCANDIFPEEDTSYWAWRSCPNCGLDSKVFVRLFHHTEVWECPDHMGDIYVDTEEDERE